MQLIYSVAIRCRTVLLAKSCRRVQLLQRELPRSPPRHFYATLVRIPHFVLFKQFCFFYSHDEILLENQLFFMCFLSFNKSVYDAIAITRLITLILLIPFRCEYSFTRSRDFFFILALEVYFCTTHHTQTDRLCIFFLFKFCRSSVINLLGNARFFHLQASKMKKEKQKAAAAAKVEADVVAAANVKKSNCIMICMAS